MTQEISYIKYPLITTQWAYVPSPIRAIKMKAAIDAREQHLSLKFIKKYEGKTALGKAAESYILSKRY